MAHEGNKHVFLPRRITKARIKCSLNLTVQIGFGAIFVFFRPLQVSANEILICGVALLCVLVIRDVLAKEKNSYVKDIIK